MAGALVPATDVDEWRHLSRADLRVTEFGAQRAARMEPTARRRIHRTGYVAGEDDPLAPELRIGHRDGRHQGGRVGVLLALEQVVPLAELGDAAQVHHRDAIADVLDDAHVVGDEHVGQPELTLERLEQVEHLRLDRHVEGRHRLVAHDQVGFEDECPGDADALALPTAELVRIAPRVVGLQPDHVHHPRDLGASLGRRSDAVDAQPLADAVADRRARVEAGVRVLEDDLHPPAIRLERRALQRHEVDPIEPDRTGGRIDQPQQQAPDGRLAAARLADEAEGLAAPDVERHAVDGLHLADRALQDAAPDREVLDEVVDLDERRAPFGHASPSTDPAPVAAAAPTGMSVGASGITLPAASW
jgi:hypothetical protein